MRSVHAVLLAVVLIPCLSAAQEKSEPASSSADTGSRAGKIVKAPGHVVGASGRALGRLIKHVPRPSLPKPAEETKAPSTPAQPTGLTGFVQVQATSTPLGLVTSLAADLGYNFTEHFGGDVGLPVFMVRSPFSLTTNHDWVWTTLLGDPYVDIHYRTSGSGVNFVTVLTGTIPTARTERVFTTGRFGVDLFNHVERKFKTFTPFVNFGAANGTVNRYYMPRPYSMARPYQTFGFIGDVEGGADFQIRPGLKIGGSGYALLPGGSQKVYSRLVEPGSAVVGDPAHNRYFYHEFLTRSGTYLDQDSSNPLLGSDIARDNGYSGWVEIGGAHNVTLTIGYTHSLRYSYDALNVSLNFDATSLLKFLMTPR